MPYESISAQRHGYLKRDYVGNRSEFVDPIQSYHEDVQQWARTAKKRIHEHCQCLLKAAANPRLLAIAVDQIGRKRILKEDAGLAAIPNCYPWEWLRKIQKRVLNGGFRRGKYRKYEIPKPGKSGFRTIEVPPDDSRLLARNLSNLLTPLLDPDFYSLSMGFRPGRSPAHCLQAARQLTRRGLVHVVACDIRDAFGTVPKKRMLQILSSRLHQSPVMRLIEELLDRNRKRGIPQGLAISPICLNVYLDHMLDRWWVENFPNTVLVRYADDLAVFCETPQTASDCFAALRSRVENIGMQIKESMHEAIYDLSVGDNVNWVGFNVSSANGKMKVRVNESSWCKLEASLLEHKHKHEKGEAFTDFEIASIGYQWLTQKASAIQKAELPGVAAQIRQLADHCGLNMTEFTDAEAREAWQTGRHVAKRAHDDVSRWLAEHAALAS